MERCIICHEDFQNLCVHVFEKHHQAIFNSFAAPTDEHLCAWLDSVLSNRQVLAAVTDVTGGVGKDDSVQASQADPDNNMDDNDDSADDDGPRLNTDLGSRVAVMNPFLLGIPELFANPSTASVEYSMAPTGPGDGIKAPGRKQISQCALCDACVESRKLQWHTITKHFKHPLLKCTACDYQSRYHVDAKKHLSRKHGGGHDTERNADKTKLNTDNSEQNADSKERNADNTAKIVRIEENFAELRQKQKECFPNSKCYTLSEDKALRAGQNKSSQPRRGKYRNSLLNAKYCTVCRCETAERAHPHVKRRHFALPLFKCGECDFKSKRRECMGRHMTRRHPGAEVNVAKLDGNFAILTAVKLKCFPTLKSRTPLDKLEFPSDDALEEAEAAVDQMQAVGPTTTETPSCTICQEEVKPKRLQNHVLCRHFRLPLFACSECSMESRWISTINKHRKSHHENMGATNPIYENKMKLQEMQKSCFPGRQCYVR